MINLTFNKENFEIIIEDTLMKEYARILSLKDIILLGNENITELTLLDDKGSFLYNFNLDNKDILYKLTNIDYLGELVGYSLALNTKNNFNRILKLDILSLENYFSVYYVDSKQYIYYNDRFNLLPNLIEISNEPQKDINELLESSITHDMIFELTYNQDKIYFYDKNTDSNYAKIAVNANGNFIFYSSNLLINFGTGDISTQGIISDYPNYSELNSILNGYVNNDTLSYYSRSGDVLQKSNGYTGTLTIGLLTVTITNGQIVSIV